MLRVISKDVLDNVDHHVLVQILRRRIADEHFIGLIWKFLKAGYMENWVLLQHLFRYPARVAD